MILLAAIERRCGTSLEVCPTVLPREPPLVIGKRRTLTILLAKPWLAAANWPASLLWGAVAIFSILYDAQHLAFPASCDAFWCLPLMPAETAQPSPSVEVGRDSFEA